MRTSCAISSVTKMARARSVRLWSRRGMRMPAGQGRRGAHRKPALRRHQPCCEGRAWPPPGPRPLRSSRGCCGQRPRPLFPRFRPCPPRRLAAPTTSRRPTPMRQAAAEVSCAACARSCSAWASRPSSAAQRPFQRAAVPMQWVPVWRDHPAATLRSRNRHSKPPLRRLLLLAIWRRNTPLRRSTSYGRTSRPFRRAGARRWTRSCSTHPQRAPRRPCFGTSGAAWLATAFGRGACL